MKILIEHFKVIFHLHTIFYQLVLFAVVIGLIPFLIFFIILNKTAVGLIEEELSASHRQVQAQYIAGIEYKLSLYNDTIINIANNSVIVDTLYQLEHKDNINAHMEGNTISREIGKFMGYKNQAELKNCMLYSNNKANPVYGWKVATIESIQNTSWYLDYLHNANNYFFSSGNNRDSVMSFIEEIQYVNIVDLKSENLGFVKMDLDVNGLFSPATGKDEEFYFDILVMNNQNKIIFSSLPDNNYNINSNELKNDMSHIISENNEFYKYKDFWVYSSEIEKYQTNILLFFNTSQFANRKSDFRNTTIPFSVVLLLLIVISSYWFSKSFTKRVSILVSKMKKAETGDFNMTESVGGNDEISSLDKDFDKMMYRIEQLIHRNYIQQLENKEAQIRNLQLQINPHFLYNTLEIVGSIAAINQVFEICNITERLGEIFRYSLGKDSGDYASVEQELHNTENYIYIQKIRFGDRFEVVYNIDKTLLKYQILRFVLQPLVENAIQHGFSKIEKNGALNITVMQENVFLIIKVEDNGFGMSDEQVSFLEKHINNPILEGEDISRNKGIGIRNVNQRIKIIFGDKYGIIIKSVIGEGTAFIVRLPLLSQED